MLCYVLYDGFICVLNRLRGSVYGRGGPNEGDHNMKIKGLYLYMEAQKKLWKRQGAFIYSFGCRESWIVF